MSLALSSLASSAAVRATCGWIGVDLGTRAIKLAQLERGPAGPRLRASAVIETPAGMAPLPDAAACRWIEGTLRAWVRADSRFRGRRVAGVLSASRLQWHNFEFPQGTDNELRAMVAQELAGDGSAPQFDIWRPQGASPAGPNQVVPVNAVSLPRQVVDALSAALDGAGFECLAVDAPSHSLARAGQLCEPGRPCGESTAVLDWGASSAHLTLAVDGACVFTRTLRDSGMATLLEACARAMEIDPHQVAWLLRMFGLPAPADARGAQREVQNLLFEFSAAALNHIASELHKTLAYLKMQWPALAPRQVWLAGFGATVHNAAAYLAHKCGVPVCPWRLAAPVPSAPQGPVTHEEALLAHAAALSALAWES